MELIESIMAMVEMINVIPIIIEITLIISLGIMILIPIFKLFFLTGKERI